MRRAIASVVLAVLVAFGHTPATAQESGSGDDVPTSTSSTGDQTAAGPAWTLAVDLRGRNEPLGTALVASAYHRHVYRADGSLLFDGVYLQSGADLNLSPAIIEAGAHIEWMPIRVFVLRLQYAAVQTFGTLGYMLSFPSAEAAFGEAQVERREGSEEAGLGHRFTLQPTLQAKFGPVIVRSQFELIYHLFDAFEGPVVREPVYDQLQEERDGIWVSSTVLAWQLWSASDDSFVIAGPSYEQVGTFEAGTGRSRLGLVAVALPPWSAGVVGRPRFYIQSGVNLSDRNREGRLFVQGGVGFDVRLGAAR